MNKIPLNIEKINNVNDLEAIKDIWNSLLENNDTKTVELTYEWQVGYWQQFHQDAELFILIIREAGSIIAISPLKITTKKVLGIGIRCLELIAARTSNYQDLIIGKNSDDVLVCILDYLLWDREAWDQLNLLHIPETSKTAHFFVRNPCDFPLLKLVEKEKCAYLSLEKSWEEHKKNLGYHRRRRMTNNRNRIERDIGKIQLRTSATDNQLASDLQRFFLLHQKRWNHTDTPSQFRDPRYGKFYAEVGLELLPKGQMDLSVLEAGGITLAQVIYFTYRQKILLQLCAYDPDYSYYSPLVFLFELLIEEKLASDILEIDFGSYYPWKESWANQLKNRLNLTLFPKRPIPYIIYLLTKQYLTVRTSLRQHPRILNMIKAIVRKARILNFSLQRAE